jgi:diguanylate cyclase (GGDEF)-like protein
MALDGDKPIADFIHDTWTVDKGLPQSTIRAAIQSRDGYLWFGSHEGLARYDGRRFTVFNEANTPLLKGSGISALCEGRDGSLYIGLRDGGVIRYLAGKFTALEPPEGLPRGEVSALAEDAGEALWIGTSGGGLARWKGGKLRKFDVADGLPHASVTSLLVRTNGDVFVGTFNGLVSIRGDELKRAPTGSDADHMYVPAMIEDRNRRLYIATYKDGLYVQDEQGWRHFTRRDGLASDTLTGLLQDRHGAIWIGCLEGLHRLSNGRIEQFGRTDGLTNNLIRALLEDAEGSLWVGTNGGLDRFRDGLITTWGTRRGLVEEFTRTVIEDRNGAVWIGTADGLFRIDEKGSARFTQRDGLMNNAVLALDEASDGSLWIGTDAGGLHRMSKGRIENIGQKIGMGAAAVRAIVELRNKEVLVGTNSGLLRIRPDGKVSRIDVADGLPSPQVISILEHGDGSIWVGTRAGIVVLRDGKIDPVSKELDIKAWVLALSEDTEGHVLAGTGVGLVRTVGRKVQSFGVAQGLPSRAYFSVVDDARGSIWLCSNHGMVQLSKTELDQVAAGQREKVEPVLYGRSEGMATAQCNGGSQPAGWRTKDGRLMFATARGIAVVEAGRKRARNQRPPPVHVIDVAVDSANVPFTDRIDLAPGKHRIDFSYVGLSLIDPDKVRYRYRLHGFDKEWIDAGNEHRAVYTNLQPGMYRFQVIAANNDGVWNEDGDSINVEYRPHFYETTWFRVAGAMLIVFMVLSIYRMRVMQLNHHARELRELVDERTQALALEKEKLEAANEEKARLLLQVRQQSEAFERLSKEDGLTGLANRRELDRLLTLEFERAKRNQQPLCVVLADLDHFKRVNDQFSHSIGDEVLRAVGRIFREGCRANDIAARYGGEEFALVLPETRVDDAKILCERLRETIAAYDWKKIHPYLTVTMSFGIALRAEQDNQDKLLDAADARLYQAKLDGRNRVCA